RVLKVDFAAEELRHEDAHELAEDMTERQQIEKANRVKRSLPLTILVNLALKRTEVRQQIALRDDDAFRLGGRPRCEDDFGDVVFGNVSARERRRFVMGDSVGQFIEPEPWQVKLTIRAVYKQPGIDLLLHAGDEIGRAFNVERHDDDAARKAAEESRHPLGAV